ncbi:MAG: rhomboid family intramembrane serine protease [Campylobacter sp.]
MSLSFWRDDGMKFRATLALIALNLVVFLLQIMQPREFEIYFGLNYLFFEKNLLFQPLSSFFLHANFTHLAMNMAVLWLFGSQIETRFGAIKFVSIYIIGGVLTALFSLVFISFGASGGHFINVVGASGAICVLFGVYSGVLRGAWRGMFVALLLMSFLPMAFGVNIAWYAHIIGFGVGIVFVRMGAKFGIFY